MKLKYSGYATHFTSLSFAGCINLRYNFDRNLASAEHISLHPSLLDLRILYGSSLQLVLNDFKWVLVGQLKNGLRIKHLLLIKPRKINECFCVKSVIKLIRQYFRCVISPSRLDKILIKLVIVVIYDISVGTGC